MDVVPVLGPKDLARFIRYPHLIYRGDPRWVAPLASDERTRLTPGKNPFFEHAEAVYLMARDRGRDVGRVAASVDRNFDQFQGERQAAFGFLEAESADAVAALLQAAENWGRERGARVLRGPLNFTTNDDCGLLIRGFEHPPTILMPYNQPTYPAWVEAAGFKKAKDLYAFKVPIPETPELEIPQIARIAQKVRERFRVRVRPINMKRFGEELQRVKEIYNSAWDKNWGFVPMTDREIDHMAAQLKPAIVPELAIFAEIDGESVGFALAIPDVNVALKPLHGRLFPFGIVRLLWTLPRIRTSRLMALGVKAGYRRRGIDAALVHQAAVASKALGHVWCEVGWTLEDNDLVNRLIEAVNGERYKTYRIYERGL
ncbi:MAG TPA: N-acetyltransferase [Candidatus Eisenbacteria bacterium]